MPADMPNDAQMPPVRLALIGAGIFARDAHLPSLSRLRDRFDLAAIYSRTQASADALAEYWRELQERSLDEQQRPRNEVSPSHPLTVSAATPAHPAPVETTTDLPALLARDDIDAVDILLPIPVQAEIVAQALAAGKHVISEKPIAPDRTQALALIDLHRRRPERVWMVAENWRYEEAFVRAAELIRSGAIGRPLLAHWAQYSPFLRQGSKYAGSAWRRSGLFAGGLLLDGGVHHMAVLRMLLGEITSVSAVVGRLAPDLPPADTLTALLTFAGGAQAVYANTFALGSPFGAPLTITGERGSLRIERGKVELAISTEKGAEKGASGRVQVTECAIHTGVDDELAAFAAAVGEGRPHRNTPLEALADLAAIEGMLRSAEDGRQHAPAV